MVRPEPVAQEIAVNATGTRPGDGTDKRELFSEETNTVLVSPDGAVIRLSATVVAGQLIFLTNKNTKVEIVCQVLGQRSRPTGSYVELQFTEKIADFWGVAFPEAAVERASPLPKATKKAQPAQETDYVLAEQTAKPTENETEQLHKEMEVLRKQWLENSGKEGEKKTAVAPVVIAPAVMEALFAAPAVATSIAPAAAHDESTQGIAIPWPKEMGIADALKSEPEPANTKRSQAPVDSPTEEKGIQEKATQAGTSLTLPKSLSEGNILNEMLPKLALDFSKAPQREAPEEGEVAQAGRKPALAGFRKWALGILAVVLLAVVGVGAWKTGFLPLSGSAGTAAPAVKPVVVAKAPLKNDGGVKASSLPETVGTANGATAGDAKPDTAIAPEGAKKIAANNDSVTAPAESVARTDSPQKNDLERADKKSLAAEQGTNSAAEVSVAAEDGALVPAKLLKAATPVYPPDAMRSFITGDVTLKVVVDAKGNVGKMEVISGPTALRGAALDALKQYQYAAATRGGKGVASDVQVVIKFWFDP